jgi:hypothetical protein
MSNLRETEHNHLIMESIKIGISTPLANGHITKHFVVRELIGTLTSTRLANGRTIANHLGLDRCCIY